MERLHSVYMFAPDIQAANAALVEYADYSGDKLAPLRSQKTDKFLLTSSEITAILNGIALLDYRGKIQLYGPNGHPDEKFRMLRGTLLRELGQDR
jgi:hypothetical protein